MPKLTPLFAEWQSAFPKNIERLRAHLKGHRERQARFAGDLAQLNLRIGIMGQVKAGKSTFLNALLFDGRPVLPEAATPKTANLTCITHGPRHELRVEFYSPEEWQALCQLAANEQNDSDEAKAARELQALLKQVGLSQADVQRLLAQPTLTLPAANLQELMALMNDYVGNNGHYTPLVKMTHLLMPMPELQGFDVVDTPGMNDPVVSRTQKTREYMQECDVVFFLSRAGQFLDTSDIGLLTQQLPLSGIRRMVLVGGQLDGALLDAGYDCDSLADTLTDTRRRVQTRAQAELEKFARRNDEMGDGYAERAAMLRALKTPILASTFAHGSMVGNASPL